MASIANRVENGAAITYVNSDLALIPHDENEHEPPSTSNCYGRTDERTLWTRLWQGVAGTSLVLNLAAMSIEGSSVAIVAGVIACLIAPVVIFLQFRLQDTDTLRTVQNQLRKEVNRLHGENTKLTAEITQLETQTGRLQEAESDLQKRTKEQGISVETLVSLVQENRVTLNALHAATKAELMQIVVNAVIESDFDSSGTFADQEIKILEMRMKSCNGVIVNEKLLMKTVYASDRRLSTVLNLVNHLDRPDLTDEERIFKFDMTYRTQ